MQAQALAVPIDQAKALARAVLAPPEPAIDGVLMLVLVHAVVGLSSGGKGVQT